MSNPCPWTFRPRIRLMNLQRSPFSLKADLPVGFPYRFNSSLQCFQMCVLFIMKLWWIFGIFASGIRLITHELWLGFLVHLSPRLKCTIVIMRCPSSVVVNFSNFLPLKPLNRIQRKLTGSKISTKFVFLSRSEKQDGRIGLWIAETFSTTPLESLTEFKETWMERRSQRPPSSMCFWSRSE